jgi:short-subunit dehydrogenase
MAQHHLGGATVVITGASSGIGQATAEAFAREGARLVLAARGPEALEQVAARCRELGAAVAAVPTDITDTEAVQALAERAVQFGGGIDVWVSVVGTGAVGRFHEVPMAAHEQVIRANLLGHMHDAHAVLPVFLRQERGVLININSVGGYASVPFAAAYGASKFGLRGFTEALRAELADQPHIHVCDVFPAFIDTPGLNHGANYMGRRLSAPPPVYDARHVAATVLQLARRPRDSAMVGSVVALIRAGHALAPALSMRFMAQFMASYFRRAEAVPVTEGALFAPMARQAAIDGGLRSPRQRAVGLSVAGVAVLAGAAAVALLLRPQPPVAARSWPVRTLEAWQPAKRHRRWW